MSGGIPTFAAGPSGPAPGPSGPLQLRIRPQGSVVPLGGGGGGGALPGDGSYGDPIQGFRQINAQMAQTQRTLTAMSTVSNGINAGFEAANATRNAGQRAQLSAGFEAAQARREAMFAAPPVTGPMLPPDFAETARVPAPPAVVPPPPVAPPGLADPPPPDRAAGAAVIAPPMPLPVPTGGVLAGLGRPGAAGRVPLPGPLGLATLLGGLAAAGVAVLSGRTQGSVPTSGQLMPGLGYRFDPAAPGGAQVTLDRFDPGTSIALPYASLTATPQGALTTRDGVVVGHLKGDSFEIDVNALRAAVPGGPLGSPGLTPAPPAPGPEGFTPAAPGGLGTREGFGIAPPTPPLGGFTPLLVAPPQTGFDPVAPGLGGGLVLENRATTPQWVHDAVGAALQSADDAKRLEGEVGQYLIENGYVLNSFNRTEFRVDGTKLGEVDIETTEAIIEVTGGKGGKGDQIDDLINNIKLNPRQIPVIIFAPSYGRFAISYIEKRGAIVVKNYEELSVELARIRGTP